MGCIEIQMVKTGQISGRQSEQAEVQKEVQNTSDGQKTGNPKTELTEYQ